MLYPLKFKKVFINKVWGGTNFSEKLDMNLPENVKIGESWEVSAHPNGMGIVENGELAGKSLQEIHETYKNKLVGDKVYEKYGNMFPLLIKYLDINDRLSIQVHPDDEVALKKHNELGKSESWYVIYASDDAKIILGMKKGYNKEKFLEKAKNNEFDDMFEIRQVKTEDFIDIAPGTVHASLEGSILIAEIQENSDITYRIYDFDREENGVKRDLHLEDSANVIDYDTEHKIINTKFSNSEKNKRLISKEYYTIDKILIEESYEDLNPESLIIYSILKGEGELTWDTGSVSLKKGETVLIPVKTAIKLKGNFEILRTTI